MIKYPCGKKECANQRSTFNKLRPPHTYTCIILEILERENVWSFSPIFIIEQIMQTHTYFKYMEKATLSRAIRKCLAESSNFKRNNNFFKFVGDRKGKNGSKDHAKSKTSVPPPPEILPLQQQVAPILSKYVEIIKRTLGESPTKAATTYEIYKNISRDSKFRISFNTIECVLANSGEDYFAKIHLSDDLMLWALSKTEDTSKIINRCMKVIKVILRMSETGAGTIQEIQKTLYKQCSYKIDFKTLEYVLGKFESIHFRRAAIGDIIFWENI